MDTIDGLATSPDQPISAEMLALMRAQVTAHKAGKGNRWPTRCGALVLILALGLRFQSSCSSPHCMATVLRRNGGGGRLLHFALRIWLKSPAAYGELQRSGSRLPSVRTLQRLRNRVYAGPGWHAEVVSEMMYALSQRPHMLPAIQHLLPFPPAPSNDGAPLTQHTPSPALYGRPRGGAAQKTHARGRQSTRVSIRGRTRL